MPATSSVSPTSNPYINGVLSGIKWGANSLTFSFPTDPGFYGASYGSGEATMGFEAFTVTQQNATRSILSQYSSVINFSFTEVTETTSTHGDLRFAESDLPSTAWAYYPSSMDLGGDVWFNNSKSWYDNPAQGNYAYYTIMHEIGHSMGLKHPHSATASFGSMPLDRDSVEYTVMSYRSYVGGGTSGLTVGSTSYPQTLMMYDIVALQEMYGANFSTNSGNTTYRWDQSTGRMYVDDAQATSPNGNKIFLTVWDGGGHDTYDFSNYTTNLDVNLSPGAWSIVSTTQLADLGSGKKAAGNIANALQYQGNVASLIEDAIGGSGNDKIVGNAANNKITGGAGNDYLDGGLGVDTACYSGMFSDYEIVYNLDDSWTITDARLWCDGVDALWNFEWLQFYDVTVRLDSSLFDPTIGPPSIAALLNDSEISGDRITNNAALSLSGIAVADSTIKIYAGAVLLATAVADANGNWAATTSALADGQYQLTATATDGSGTTSVHSSQYTVLVDTAAPQAPQITGITPDSNVPGDRITNSNSVALTGTAEANSQVHIYKGQTLLGVTSADQNGQWTFDTSGNAAAFSMGCSCAECAAARAEGEGFATLSDGDHVFTALSKDAAGNSSGLSTEFQVTIDTVAPNAPTITGFSPDSNVSGDGITSASQLTLTGTAAAGSVVKVYDGATLIKTLVADSNGAWSFATNTLTNATHSFTATATDAAGNTSGSSAALQVTVDTVAPGAPVITGFSPDTNVAGDGITSASQLTLTGTAAAGSVVKVFDGATLITTLVADSNGAWSFTTNTLTNATHSFTATATDAAGNTSGSSSALQVTVDSVAPGVPVITGFSPDTNVAGDGLTSASQLTLTGTAAAGSTVKVYDGVTLIKTLVADGNGAWSFTTNTLTNATHSFTATATDAAGNTSGSSSALQVTVDSVAPGVPVITGFSPDTNVAGDGLTSASQLTLTGTAAAGSTVKVYDGGTLIKTVVADGNGAWSFTTNTLTNASHSFTATATDAAGNSSGLSTALQVTVDTVAPGAPVITGFSPDTNVAGDGITSASQLTLTGTAAAGSTVKVYDGGTLIKTLVADSNGAWSFATNTLTNATHSFTATATDAAGNTSGSSAALQVTVDTVAPGAPVITGFSPDTNVAGDGITSASQLTLTGTAAAGSVVKVFDGATLITTLVADSNGAWSFTTNTLTNATHSFTATATDAAGNTSGSSTALQVTVDTVAPGAPVITGFSPDTNLAGDGITSASQLTLTGTAAAGSVVKVYDGATLIKTLVADSNGAWSFATNTLTNATHSFTATATDAAGNTSGSSTALQVTMDTVAPGAPVITGFSPDTNVAGDGLTSASQLTLTGTAAAGSVVKVYDGATLIKTVVADSNGAWSFTTNTLTNATHSFTATATDAAGNTSGSSSALQVTVDTAAPGVPVITGFSPDSNVAGDGSTSASQLTLTGTAVVGSTVKVYDGGTLIKTVVADSNGAWSFTTNTLTNATHSFTATATDAAGNTSGSSTALQVTVDTVAPGAPVITGFSPDTNVAGDGITSASQLTLTGTAAAGSVVKVFDGATLITTLVADSNGAWSFTTNTLTNATHSFTATATDAAGNTSGSSTALQVTVDNVAPGAPVITGFSPDSNAAGDGITSASQLTLTGTAAAGSTVKVYDGATLIKTLVADGDGGWSFVTNTLANAAHSFTATATDAAGNTSGSSSALQVTVESSVPAPTIDGFSPDSYVLGDGITNASRITLTGSAEPGTEVSIFDGEILLGRVTATAAGGWSFTTSTLSNGEHAFSAIANHLVLGSSAVSQPISVLVDTLAPIRPTIGTLSVDEQSISAGITNSNAVTLTGTAEAGSLVTVIDGKTVIGTATADGQGLWNFTAASLVDGAHSFSVRSTDAAGNLSAVSAAVGIKVDTLAPGNPRIASYSTDSGILGDGITNATSIKLVGTAEAFAKIKIYDGAVLIGETVASSKGVWAFTTGTLEHGSSYDFQVTATDAAQNTSAASELSITVDRVAPTMPQILSYSPGDQVLGLTKSNVITLVGTAEAGSAIKLYNGSKYMGATVADDQGAWSFTTAALANATYRFAATATDAAGNTSPLATLLQSGSAQASPGNEHAVLVVRVDTLAPSAPVVSSFSNDTGRVGDRITSDSTLDFTGRAEAGSIVDIYAGNTLLGSTASGANGTWNFQTGDLQDGNYNFIFKATDLAGNTSIGSRPLQVTIDTSAVAPVILGISSGLTGNYSKASVLTVNGNAEAYSKVSLFAGEILIGTATANALGVWSLRTSKISDGDYSLSAVTTDLAGNQSPPSNIVAVIVDTVAPIRPVITGLTADDSLAPGTIVNSNTLIVSGTAEAGSLVTVTDGRTVIGSATADAQGVWSFTAAALIDGAHSFTVRSTDAAGNLSAVSAAVGIKVDTLAPGNPRIASYSTDSGILGDGITNATSIKLTGTAEAFAKVKIYDGDVLIGETVASKKGVWVFTTGTLEHGSSYDFKVTATDAALNTSAASNPLAITVDTDAPTMPEILSYSSGGPVITNSGVITLTGTAEAGSAVKLYNGSKYFGAAVADDTGTWSFTTSSLGNATYRFSATATDAAGNTSPLATLSTSGSAQASPAADHSVLVLTVDTKAPSAPVVSSFSSDTGRAGDRITSDTTLDIDGRAEAGSTVDVYAGDTLLGSTTTDTNGVWHFLTDQLEDGAFNFTFKATDLAGNTSVGSRPLQVTVDTHIGTPSILEVSPDTGAAADFHTKANVLTLKGEAEANSQVMVFSGEAMLGTATASASGAWTFKTNKLPDGEHQFSVTAVDGAGNVSDPSNTIDVTVDTVGPKAPVISNHTVIGNSVNFVGTAEANGFVTLYDGKAALGTVGVDESGHWSFDASGLSATKHKFSAVASDLADNVSKAQVLTVKIAAEPQYGAESGLTDSALPITFVDASLSNALHEVVSSMAGPISHVLEWSGAFQFDDLGGVSAVQLMDWHTETQLHHGYLL